MIAPTLAHGANEFGFPVIVMLIIAMMADVKTAIVFTSFPSLALNIISIIDGGNWRASVQAHWHVALYVMIGTIADAKMLQVLRRSCPNFFDVDDRALCATEKLAQCRQV